jgi:hypothetical protein
MSLIGEIRGIFGGGGKQVVGYEKGPKGIEFDKSASSSYGRPIPIVFGTFRIKGTIIQAGLYMVEVHPGLPGDMTQIALCEGEIVSVLNVWREQVKDTPGNLGITIATGTLPQSPWAWMTTNHPEFALGYGGVALASCDSGHAAVPTGELERSTFEIRGLRATVSVGGTGAYDASPYGVLTDILTSSIFGLGWSTSILGDQDGGLAFVLGADGTAGSGYKRYTETQLWVISMAITEQRPTRDIIGEILTATDSVPVWSEGTLKVRPLGEASTTDGSATYTPYLTPQYDLGAIASSGESSDFLAGLGDAWVTAERVPRAETFNCYPVEWTNRITARTDTTGALLDEPRNAYNADTEDGNPDPVDVDLYGLRKAPVTSLRCITRPAHAKAIADILTKRALHTARVRYRFRLGWRYALLEPTDLVTLTDSVLGISRRLVRITEIEEQEDGSFDVVAEEVGTITAAASAVYTVT